MQQAKYVVRLDCCTGLCVQARNRIQNASPRQTAPLIHSLDTMQSGITHYMCVTGTPTSIIHATKYPHLPTAIHHGSVIATRDAPACGLKLPVWRVTLDPQGSHRVLRQTKQQHDHLMYASALYAGKANKELVVHGRKP